MSSNSPHKFIPFGLSCPRSGMFSLCSLLSLAGWEGGSRHSRPAICRLQIYLFQYLNKKKERKKQLPHTIDFLNPSNLAQHYSSLKGI